MIKNILIFLAIIFSLPSHSFAVSKNKTDFNNILIEAEKVIIEILNDFKKNGMRIAFGYEGVTGMEEGFAVNNDYMTTDDIPEPNNQRQLFMKPYVAKIPAEIQGYCAGNLDTAKMFFVPPEDPLTTNYGTDSNGQAYILLNCGSFSKFNCSKNKCKIEVRGAKWGEQASAFGERLFFNRERAKQDIPELKNKLYDSMVDAFKYLK